MPAINIGKHTGTLRLPEQFDTNNEMYRLKCCLPNPVVCNCLKNKAELSTLLHYYQAGDNHECEMRMEL